ncbi:protein HBS1-like isoform X1 [Oppia nitens]|uniref:protein HBS1-like isoform X1 n=1 Tax=Oppia nitens TaxID=1686743 RepID=UPI0023D9C06C|nr:protein HBS1-like isoform X1 [Oppia nitens]
MSRHRNIRSLNYDQEYDDVYSGSYGQSYEDTGLCISPTTEQQFMYNRSRSRSISDRRNDSLGVRNITVDEEDEDMDFNEDLNYYRNETINMDPIERAKLISCVEEMENVVGDTIHQSLLIKAAKRYDYDMKLALDSVLNSHTNHMETSLQPQQVTTNKGKQRVNEVNENQMSNKLVITENHCTDCQTDNTKSSSPLFVSLTAKCKLKCESNRNRICDIKQSMVEYFNRNDIKVFSFENESKNKSNNELKPGNRAQSSENTDQCDKEVEKINTGIQKLLTNKSDDYFKTFSSPVRKDLDKSRLETNNLSQLSTPNSPVASRTGSRMSSPNHEKNSEVKTPKSNQSKALNPETAVLEYNKNRKEGKPNINLVVIGHVDAGKSTLMGHLLVLLGFVSKKMIHRYETDSKKMGKNSFLYAWVLDETQEERSRGITMDIAESRFETDHKLVTLLDAPGHKDFIPNMITGATQADVALLVVDATKGEFETGFELGGQTREHTLLIRSLGISQLGVVVNKLENVNWSQNRYNEIISKLSAFLKQIGFKEQDVTFVPCSGLTGENLVKKSTIEELNLWYSGHTLVDIIDNFKPPDRPISKPFRMSLNDVFKGLTSGFCISGRIEAGAVIVGQKIIILPAGEQCVVKSISVSDTSVNTAFVGDYAILTLLGCDPNNISVGNLVCDLLNPAPVTTKFEAKIVIFNNIDIPITKGFPVILHCQSLNEQAVIKRLISQLHKSTGQVVKAKPRCLVGNTSGVVVIEIQKPICVELYKDYKDLGRFMLRSAGATIAAGLITKVL